MTAARDGHAPSLRKQVLGGASWTAAQKWAVRLTSMVTFVFLGRLLQPSEFGLVALASAIVGILQIVTEGGFGTYLVQSQDTGQRISSTAFWTAMVVSVVLTGVVVASAPLFALVFGEPGLTPLLMVLSASVLITGLSSVQNAIMQRDMEFKRLALRQMGAVVAGALVAVIIAWGGGGAWALVAQMLVTSSVATMTLWLTSPWRPTWEWDRQQARAMLDFSWKTLGGNLLYQFRNRAEQFIIAAVGGAVMLGYWTIATRIVAIMLDLSASVLSTIALPTFARLKSDPERLRRGYRKVITYTAVVTVPMSVLASQTSNSLVPLLFGEQWTASAPIAAIVMLGVSVGAMNYYDRAMYLANGRPGVDLAVTAVIIVLSVAMIWVVAPYGLVALAVANVVRTFVVWPARLAVLRRVCGLPWTSYLPSLGVLGIGAVTGIATYLVRVTLWSERSWWDVVALVAFGGAVYLALLLAVSKQAREQVRAVSRTLRRRRPRATDVRTSSAPAESDEEMARGV